VAQINQLSVTSGSVSLPNSGSVAIFSNIEDNGNLYIKSSAGIITPVGNTSGGGSGSSGTSGTSGAGSGSSGTSGTGASGSSGTSGTGISGSSGTSGTGGAGSSGTSGTGISGSSGTSGTTPAGMTSGTSGSGSSGTSGTGGATGSSGTSGTQGATGSSGTSGTGGAGSSGTSGTQGAPGATGSSGTSGTGGAGSSGTSGSSGATGTSGTSGAGGGGSSTIYNTVSRYQAFLSGDIEVFLVSSATVNTGLTWSRSGTTLTITDTSHGRSNGDMVIVRNANADNFNGTITVVDANTFTLTTANSGGTSGTEAAYSLGFTVGTPTASALTITAPSGGDVQLLSVLFATGTRSGTTLAITVPQSATNGAGLNTTTQNTFFPVFRVQNIGGSVQLAALTLTSSAPFNVFNMTSLNSSLSNLVRLDF
jgi:hypothetical protein